MFDYISNTWPQWACGALGSAIVYLFYQMVAMRQGMRALLRADIIRMYNKYHDDLGYCPIYAKQALSDEYKQYHVLGGNDVGTKLYEDIMALPTEPDL